MFSLLWVCRFMNATVNGSRLCSPWELCGGVDCACFLCLIPKPSGPWVFPTVLSRMSYLKRLKRGHSWNLLMWNFKWKKKKNPPICLIIYSKFPSATPELLFWRLDLCLQIRWQNNVAVLGTVSFPQWIANYNNFPYQGGNVVYIPLYFNIWFF